MKIPMKEMSKVTSKFSAFGVPDTNQKIGEIVRLAWYEEFLARELGKLRQDESKDRKPRNGCWNDPNTALRLGVNGAAAEMAFAKHFNIYWNPSVNVFGDAPDVGRNIQIRSSANPEGRMVFRKADKDKAGKVYFFMVGKLLDHGRTFYRIVGWLYGRDCMKDEFWDSPHDRPGAWFVPQDRLNHDLQTGLEAAGE